MKQLLTAVFCLLVLASVSSTELGHPSGDDDDPTSTNAVLTSVLDQLAVVKQSLAENTRTMSETASEVKELRQTVTHLAQKVDKLEKRDVEVSD